MYVKLVKALCADHIINLLTLVNGPVSARSIQKAMLGKWLDVLVL
ncbi:unnamed protein product [Arabidopsis thaliana]|uniref:(thale cress) hypothetical protein n=1 Tax=Arabidopsis thaliana TaxID=3702 RepID=A0A7G2EAG0_ARATH|nr:unnamed protein product [Arabidopsis thaliana]